MTNTLIAAAVERGIKEGRMESFELFQEAINAIIDDVPSMELPESPKDAVVKVLEIIQLNMPLLFSTMVEPVEA